jgi:hypothetical protein
LVEGWVDFEIALILDESDGLTAPTGFTADSVTETGVTLFWDSASGADSYDLSVNGSVVNLGDVDTYSLTGLAPNTSYSIKVRAVGASNVSAWSSAISVTTDAAASVSGTVILAAEAGKSYYLAVTAANVTSFSGKTFSVAYPDDALQMSDFAAQIQDTVTSAGAVPNTDLTLVSDTDGTLTFTVNKTIASGKSWSGVLTVIKFTATESGDQEITVGV